jgi:hypothetical protein
MPFPSFQKEKRIARPRWVQFSRWLWKAACFLGTVVVLPVVINVLSAWFTNANGIIPATSFFGQLVAHWPLTLLVSGSLLLFAVVTWTLSREQVHEPVTVSLAQQNRAHMLQRLRHSYDDLLAQSLQGRAWLELGLSSKPDAVQHQTRLLLRMPNQSTRLLPLGTTLLEVYDEAAHELLILGEPGAGKSTLLLSLARHLGGTLK